MARKRLFGLAALFVAVSPVVALAQSSGPTTGAEKSPSAMSSPSARRLFSPEECQEVQEYWAGNGRYLVQFLQTSDSGAPWQACYTSEASVWLYQYFKARSRGGKILPTQNPTATDAKGKEWDAWIDAKYEYDRFTAQESAFQLNSENQDTLTMRMTTMARNPGKCPDDLVKLVGSEPPRFFEAAKPKSYAVNFDDFSVTYKDHVPVRRKYPYFRFTDGINSPGVPMKSVPHSELDTLFQMAGLSATESRVMGAVSPLEGGFDSINTYDTGFVSAGMLQFATLKEGAGSLGEVLAEYKEVDPESFNNDFRRFGVDVSPDGLLSVVDIYCAEEKTGHDANLQVITDKRLSGVFQRAGMFRPFRSAQLRTAKKMFYPADNRIAVTIGGQIFEGRVSDVIKSEAGMATLLDRKVNTGKLTPLNKVLSDVAAKHKVTSIAGLSAYECEIVKRMKYRADFLTNTSLSQPAPMAPGTIIASATKVKGKPGLVAVRVTKTGLKRTATTPSTEVVVYNPQLTPTTKAGAKAVAKKKKKKAKTSSANSSSSQHPLT